MEAALIISGICARARSCSPSPGTRSRCAIGDLCGCAKLSGAGNPVYVALLSAARGSRDRLRVTSDEPPWPRRYRGRSGCFREGAYLVLDHLCSRGDLQYHYQHHGRAHDSAAIAILKTGQAKISDAAPPVPLPGTERESAEMLRALNPQTASSKEGARGGAESLGLRTGSFGFRARIGTMNLGPPAWESGSPSPQGRGPG